MKKGISLIVLVITIIVMIIIAGAIIISLSNTNILDKANQAVSDSDLANARNACMVAWADAIVGNDGIARADGKVVTADYYYDYLADAGFADTAENVAKKYTVTVNATSGTPSVEKVVAD